MEPEFEALLTKCVLPPGNSYRLWRRGSCAGYVRNGANPDQLLRVAPLPGSTLLKDRPKTQAFINGRFFCKKVIHQGLWRRLRHAFRPPRPFVALAGALKLAEIGVPTPVVELAVRRKQFGFPCCDQQISRALGEGRMFADDLLSFSVTGAMISRIIKHGAALLAKMHDGGFEHGDLSLRNIYVWPGANGEFVETGVIDLDGCRIYETELPLSRRRREGARFVSSIIKCVRARCPDLRLKASDLVGEFCICYRECCGVNLAGHAMNERVYYMLTRKRRK